MTSRISLGVQLIELSMAYMRVCIANLNANRPIRIEDMLLCARCRASKSHMAFQLSKRWRATIQRSGICLSDKLRKRTNMDIMRVIMKARAISISLSSIRLEHLPPKKLIQRLPYKLSRLFSRLKARMRMEDSSWWKPSKAKSLTSCIVYCGKTQTKSNVEMPQNRFILSTSCKFSLPIRAAMKVSSNLDQNMDQLKNRHLCSIYKCSRGIILIGTKDLNLREYGRNCCNKRTFWHSMSSYISLVFFEADI